MQMKEIISTAGLHSKGVSKSGTNRKEDGASLKEGQAKTTRLDEAALSQDGINMAEYDKALESLKEYAGWGNFNIDFATDDETGSIVIKIIDRDSGETLRQIPPEEILSLRSHLRDVLGMVFDHMA